MSIKRLTRKERATYLVGLAVMRQFENGSRDPDSNREFNAILQWVEHWLSNDEAFVIFEATGWLTGRIIPEEIQEALDLKERFELDRRQGKPPTPPDDDLPF